MNKYMILALIALGFVSPAFADEAASPAAQEEQVSPEATTASDEQVKDEPAPTGEIEE